MKLADLVEVDFNLLGVLSRLGIGFGFGDETVEEACARTGINTQTFLLICNVYAFDGYTPSAELLRETDLRDIVRYLHQSHAYYMDVAVKALAEALQKMLEPCEERRKSVIRSFFNQYKEELARHFEFEEKTVFPYVNAVLDRGPHADFTILQYEENHTNVEEKLSDLKRIVMKYLPPECDNRQIFDVLFYIHVLEQDLAKHTLIEDEILVPVVGRMEDNG